MQGCDVLSAVSLALPTDALDLPLTVRVETEETAPLPCWTLHTPPLRYQVASMEHWLDLNA
jgi:hypothetical protein